MVSREKDLGFKLEEPRECTNGTKMRGWGSCPVEKNKTIHSLAWGVQGIKGGNYDFRGHSFLLTVSKEQPWG